MSMQFFKTIKAKRFLFDLNENSGLCPKILHIISGLVMQTFLQEKKCASKLFKVFYFILHALLLIFNLKISKSFRKSSF